MKTKAKFLIAAMSVILVLDSPVMTFASGTLSTDKLGANSVTVEETEEKTDVTETEINTEVESEVVEYEPEVSEGYEAVKEETTGPESNDDDFDVKMPGSNRDEYQAVVNEEEEEGGIDILSILIVVLFAGIIGISVMITKMFIDTNKAQAKENEEYFIKKNEEFKASKARENESLDEYINSCEEDYSDDIEENEVPVRDTKKGTSAKYSIDAEDEEAEPVDDRETDFAEEVVEEKAPAARAAKKVPDIPEEVEPVHVPDKKSTASKPAWMNAIPENDEDDNFY